MVQQPLLTLVPDEVPPRPWIRVVWEGDVDAFSVRPLAAGLREACALEPSLLEVDLSGVTFLDSAGLVPLVQARTHLQTRMRLYDPSPPVTRLLRLLDREGTFLVVGPLPARPGPASTPLWWLSVDDGITIEQATGLLMAVHGCDASLARDLLRDQAAAHDLPVHVMAELLVGRAPGTDAPAATLHMEDVMAERARAGPPGG